MIKTNTELYSLTNFLPYLPVTLLRREGGIRMNKGKGKVQPRSNGHSNMADTARKEGLSSSCPPSWKDYGDEVEKK